LQKLETLWKTLSQAALGTGGAVLIGPCGVENIGYSNTAPTISNAKVTITTKLTVRASLPMPPVDNTLSSACEVRNDIPLPMSITSIVPNSIMPSPPSWISARMTAWPKIVKSAPVSRTIRPVTHEALVAVNSASR